MRKRRPTCDSDFSAIAVPSMHGSGYLDYTVETHASRCLKAMEEFRRLGMLCDLVLRVSHKDKTAAFKVRTPHNGEAHTAFTVSDTNVSSHDGTAENTSSETGSVFLKKLIQCFFFVFFL